MPNFDKFEQWTYEVDTWLEFNSIPSSWAVRLISAFVSGPASEYFMDFVATDHGSFKMKQIYSGLFEYCFPVDIRRKMRRDLLAARQGGDETIRNFIRRITRLSKRLGDVSHRQMVQIVWDGAHSYLRIKWADAGHDFETSSVRVLESAAVAYEVAETIRRLEQARTSETSVLPQSSTSTTKTAGSSKFSTVETRSKSSRLTNEERDKFRAENRCFYCREVGHSKHNCPALHEAPAPKIHSGAATVLEDRYTYLRGLSMDDLAKEAQASRQL
ncbi:hypothetical protein B0H16DRAFT_1895036 [Mycena metata]|uniref:CCHC-type domain-containing protein n=1 Tax=Mycena metata TaxID=1033252 RepID=A0AAD7HRI2_9AGAR|nr:hypothetical protein B0H16DRAFT_1895036 [Mycena metata]